jgi:type I restriction enzyme R subunit
VDAAIALFSGEKRASKRARSGWWTKPRWSSRKLDAAVQKLADFMQSQGLACTPEAVHSLKGDDARAAFIKTSRKCSASKPSSTNTPT